MTVHTRECHCDPKTLAVVRHRFQGLKHPIACTATSTRSNKKQSSRNCSYHRITREIPSRVCSSGLQAQTLLNMSPGSIGILVLVVYLLKKVYDFIQTACDLHLLGKKDPPKEYFTGAVVWVVGASQGIGKSLARQWAQH